MVPLSSAAGDRRVNATASRVIDHVTMWPDFLPKYHLGDYPSLGQIQKGQDGPIFKVTRCACACGVSVGAVHGAVPRTQLWPRSERRQHGKSELYRGLYVEVRHVVR